MKLRIILLAILCLFGTLFAQNEDEMFNKPSKRELYSRARDVLRTSLENKDHEKARQALEYLQANVKNGAPLTIVEEFRIYFEIEDYEKGIILYEDYIHPSLDSLYKPKTEQRIQADDELSRYIKKRWTSNSPEQDRNMLDSFEIVVNNSSIEQQYKDLYQVFIDINLIDNHTEIKNGDYAEAEDSVIVQKFLDDAIKYTTKYPMTGPSIYLKEQTIPQVQKRVKKIQDYRRDPLIYKYYTGGLSVYAGKWLGFLSGEATDYVNDKMGSTFIIEGEIQIRRVSLGFFWYFGLITTPKFDQKIWGTYEDESIGFTLGYVTYDSRFLKATPFIGYSSTDFMTIDAIVEPHFALGLNIDSHLLATPPGENSGLSIALNARFKYMMQIGSLELTTINKTPLAINHTFALEFGIFVW